MAEDGYIPVKKVQRGAIYSVSGGYYIIEVISIDKVCRDPACNCHDNHSDYPPPNSAYFTVKCLDGGQLRHKNGVPWTYHHLGEAPGGGIKPLPWALIEPPCDELQWLDDWVED